ncbi:thioredoxin domain-containing protein [Psychrobium sp. MM17-31]|uniref:TlpA family protein disulfide reductase n=1 Tax=Psychrobium sp. MM17-31 TaxID=2917758 RepID=UPI001EF609F3|nr:thioredoxin-like domain-containing protein [Psychrobium sp. MM17-31]MCG7530444.1 thioredoxin domain-containing protein [Psychrobium sp. MM17-31]
MTTNKQPTTSSTQRWLKSFAQLLVIVVCFIAVSLFLSRNMLATKTPAPKLIVNQHLSPLHLTDKSNDLAFSENEPTLVYFFAPWCTVCALSQPSLSSFQQVKPNVKIIMVALDWETREQVETFKQEHEFEHQILLGDHHIKQQWRVDAYPSYYFVNGNGEISSKDRGLVTLPGLVARAL